MTKPELELLQRCETALTDWIRHYTPEHCGSSYVKETASRVADAGGWLAYTADLLRDIRKALQ